MASEEGSFTRLGVDNICSFFSNISPLQITACHPLPPDRTCGGESATQLKTKKKVPRRVL